MEFLTPQLIIILLVQIGSIIAVIVTNKTNVSWLTKIQVQQGERITKIEDRVNNINHR